MLRSTRLLSLPDFEKEPSLRKALEHQIWGNFLPMWKSWQERPIHVTASTGRKLLGLVAQPMGRGTAERLSACKRPQVQPSASLFSPQGESDVKN